MSTEVSRYKWDNMVVVLRDGTDDSIWDGRVKNLVYDSGSMEWIAEESGGGGSGGTVSGSWTATEQGMLQRAYDALRTYGLLT